MEEKNIQQRRYFLTYNLDCGSDYKFSNDLKMLRNIAVNHMALLLLSNWWDYEFPGTLGSLVVN